MNEQNLYTLVDAARERTLQAFESISEETADIIPPGFNNNIRWHLGHILTVQERLVMDRSKQPNGVPAEYVALFGNGTKPADWPEQGVPALETLREQLVAQSARIKATFQGRLDDKLAEPFKGLDTAGEIIGFSLFHEGIHLGYIGGIKRALIGMS